MKLEQRTSARRSKMETGDLHGENVGANPVVSLTYPEGEREDAREKAEKVIVERRKNKKVHPYHSHRTSTNNSLITNLFREIASLGSHGANPFRWLSKYPSKGTRVADETDFESGKFPDAIRGLRLSSG